MFEVVKTGLLPSPAPVNGTVRAGQTIYSVQVPRDQKTGKTITTNTATPTASQPRLRDRRLTESRSGAGEAGAFAP